MRVDFENMSSLNKCDVAIMNSMPLTTEKATYYTYSLVIIELFNITILLKRINSLLRLYLRSQCSYFHSYS